MSKLLNRSHVDKEETQTYMTLFIIAFLIRIVPEILSWPWLIGWDTPEYVANLKDFLVTPSVYLPWMGKKRLIPPLLNALLFPLAHIVDPWYIYKIFPSIIYGFLVISFYKFSKSLNFSGNVAFYSSILFALYPTTLRFSWDLHRNTLGLVFVLVQLSEILRKGNPWMILISSILSYLSNEFTFTISLINLTLYAAICARERRLKELLIALPGLMIGILVLIILMRSLGISYVIFIRWSNFSEVFMYKLLPSLVLYLPLIPSSLKGMKRVSNGILHIFTLTLMFLAFSDVILPISFRVWNRWMYHLVIPFSVYASPYIFERKLKFSYTLPALIVVALGILLLTIPYSTSSTHDPGKANGNLLSDLINKARVLMKKAKITYSLMHSSTPINEEKYYLAAAKYLASKTFDKLFVGYESYGFIHIERRFAINVTPISLTISDICKYIPNYFENYEGLHVYLLIHDRINGKRLNCPTVEFEVEKKFGSVVLLRVKLNELNIENSYRRL